MIQMKRIFALLLSLLLVFSLCACTAEEAADTARAAAEIVLEEMSAQENTDTADAPVVPVADDTTETAQENDEALSPADADTAEEAPDAEAFDAENQNETATEYTEAYTDDELLEEAAEEAAQDAMLDPDGSYTTKEDVALYIHQYGCLPSNFISKKEAQALGWSGGSLEPYAPGKCIGGSYFGNYEGALPAKKGRSYTECDIDTLGAKSRGAKRIVFSNDGLVYYTEDHYTTFELLYGEP